MPLPILHIAAGPTAAWAGDAGGALTDFATNAGSLTTSQTIDQTEIELAASIKASTDCKLGLQFYMFDDGAFPSTSPLDLDGWWPDHFAEAMSRVDDWVGFAGQAPDFLIMGTENIQHQAYLASDENATIQAYIKMTEEVMTCVENRYGTACKVIPYANGQMSLSTRDGWVRRDWPWPRGTWNHNQVAYCAQCYNGNQPLEFWTAAAKTAAEMRADRGESGLLLAPWVSLSLGVGDVTFTGGNPNAHNRDYDVTLTEAEVNYLGQMINSPTRYPQGNTISGDGLYDWSEVYAVVLFSVSNFATTWPWYKAGAGL